MARLWSDRRCRVSLGLGPNLINRKLGGRHKYQNLYQSVSFPMPNIELMHRTPFCYLLLVHTNKN